MLVCNYFWTSLEKKINSLPSLVRFSTPLYVIDKLMLYENKARSHIFRLFQELKYQLIAKFFRVHPPLTNL